MKDADSNAAPSQVLAQAWGEYGHALLKVGKYELAVAALETALREPSLDNRFEMPMRGTITRLSRI